jgi:hypothetical protein
VLLHVVDLVLSQVVEGSVCEEKMCAVRPARARKRVLEDNFRPKLRKARIVLDSGTA